ARRVQAPQDPQGGRPGAGPAPGAADPLPGPPARPRAPGVVVELLQPVLERPICPTRRPARKDGPMTSPAPTSLVIEKELPHSPEKIWRALTEGPLIKQWLMDNDFQPVVGRKFNFRATPMPQWNGVIDGEVLVVEPNRKLSYS